MQGDVLGADNSDFSKDFGDFIAVDAVLDGGANF